MGRLKVGVMIESFRLGVKKGIRKAAELGADGFQIYVTQGEMAPWNLTETGRRDFKHLVERRTHPDFLAKEISSCRRLKTQFRNLACNHINNTGRDEKR